jgi:hypothetical protein
VVFFLDWERVLAANTSFELASGYRVVVFVEKKVPGTVSI